MKKIILTILLLTSSNIILTTPALRRLAKNIIPRLIQARSISAKSPTTTEFLNKSFKCERAGCKRKDNCTCKQYLNNTTKAEIAKANRVINATIKHYQKYKNK